MATQNPQRAALGEMLRNLRLRAGKGTHEVEAELGWYAGKASRVETGMRGIVPAEATQLADLFEASKKERATLAQLALAARKRESPAHVADFAQTYVTFERQATNIDYYDGELIHALFQTERYARAVLATGSGDVAQRVSDRLARQDVLRGGNPPQVRMVLGEAALHVDVGGPDVMREQIEHLLKQRDRPNVSIRVVPFAAGAHRALGVGFYIVHVVSPAAIKRVYTEGLANSTYIHESDEVSVYESTFADLWELAASDQESATILRRRIT